MDDDRSLYRRWLATRDEDAFGTLARRHADLVVVHLMRALHMTPRDLRRIHTTFE